jgi:SAM-dependent methyltransferase
VNKKIYKGSLLSYLDRQNFNWILSYHHSSRHRFVINFVKEKIKHETSLNILDLGCGPAQLNVLLQKELKGTDFKYIGVDASSKFFDIASKTCLDGNSSVVKQEITQYLKNSDEEFDLICLLEVVEHMTDSEFHTLISELKVTKFKNFIVTVPNETGLVLVLKNLASWLMGYKRFKEYSLIENVYILIGKWEKISPVVRHHKGYKWSVTLHYLTLAFPQRVKLFTVPFPYLPRFFSPTIGFLVDGSPD